jgi:dipeptidyl aminopeptidase/acylaminoacyl peptidase
MKEVLRYKYRDRDAKLGIMNFVVDSDDGFIGSDMTGRDALYRYNFAVNSIGEKIFEHPSSDLEGVLLSRDGRHVQGVTYVEDQQRVKWLDNRLAALQAELDASFPGRQARIVSRSHDDQKLIIWAGTSSDPGRYFYQNRTTGDIKLLADVGEKLRKAALSPSRYVNYTARDGTRIYGYLTLPAGSEARNLPLIIVPHGGPYGVRDSGDFDSEIQFLANRGYAVLQPNYRGSSSYGTEFAKKGEGQWGRKMQDDIDDGMDWLAKAGTIDPKRVCIVGSSYGGYAALWGATRNPERYRCAASFAGVTDVERQVRYSRAFMDRKGAKSWMEKVRGEDKKFDLGSISPLSTVARLKVPVLITHGDEDQRVPLKQSSLYVKALQDAGKVHEFKLYKGEGHGFSKSENYKDYLDRLEAFLAKHNPAT